VLPSKPVLPRLAGTNAYRDKRSCALIYSSKFQDGDTPLLEAFGLDRHAVEHAREIEDIQQFIMRGAIRCPDFEGRYDVYLYDAHQAEAVCKFLVRNGIEDVELVPIHGAGIMDVTRPKPGRKPIVLDARSKAQRDTEKRAKDAERKRRERAAKRDQKDIIAGAVIS
jgi:hypothetical protein